MSIRVIFMGTPDFAVASLNAIVKSGVNVVGVITAPDKPAGRGKKLQLSAVKTYALENNIEHILQPTNLKDPLFIENLKSINADLFVVVAFRMLPEAVWSMPKLGTINLHGSLLPNYRGAAPINWAVINGEEKTGVTTFFIEKEIDTGKIIDQKEVVIKASDTAGTMHDKLMLTGANLLIETINKIEAGKTDGISQAEFLKNTKVSPAPKIFKDDCRINWNQSVNQVYNFIRGLSPYPAAWTEFTSESGAVLSFKIFETEIEKTNQKFKPGSIDFSELKQIKIACIGGFIKINSLQQSGKKRMDTKSFLLGFKNIENYTLAV